MITMCTVPCHQTKVWYFSYTAIAYYIIITDVIQQHYLTSIYLEIFSNMYIPLDRFAIFKAVSSHAHLSLFLYEKKEPSCLSISMSSIPCRPPVSNLCQKIPLPTHKLSLLNAESAFVSCKWWSFKKWRLGATVCYCIAFFFFLVPFCIQKPARRANYCAIVLLFIVPSCWNYY